MAYLTAAQVRSRVPVLANATTYPDSELNNLVSEFTDIAERYRNVAFEPRTVTGEIITRPNDMQQLGHAPVRTVTAISVDGTAVGASDLAKVIIDGPTGMISNGPWRNARQMTVTYTHGLDAPSETLLRACAEYVRAIAFSTRSGQSRDVIAQSIDGSFTRYSTPDWNRGRPTGFLEVDRLLNSVPDYRIHGVA
jgi:hypothetical protein